MQRYFSNKIENKFILSSDDSYHISKVMRMSIGDSIEIVDNDKCFLCKIIELNNNVVAEVVKEINEDRKLSIDVTLVQSLVKEQKMDFILQKTTELGINRIIPLTVERSVIKINDKKDKKIDRWNKIVKEASEQSKRLDIPVVEDIISINELCKITGYDYKFLCTVRENTKNIKNILSNVKSNDRILFVVGPEGGFTTQEEDKLIENGFITVSLGNTVLRTETAGLFIMSVINYHNMR